MRPGLTSLADTLLYEGYALFPYTPGNAKNATPTPFGIVYPPAYAARNPATFDHVRVGCVVIGRSSAKLRATVRFLQAAGERHEGAARTLELGPISLEELAQGSEPEPFAFDGATRLEGRTRLRAEILDLTGPDNDPLVEVACCVHNATALTDADAATLDRAGALRASLLSCQVVLELDGARFASPLERDGGLGAAVQAAENVNIWPVLASRDDDALLGAPIFLPDHPSMAPESLGNLFDNTEIEEALMLQIKALSDEERESIIESDPRVREMLERVDAATPEEIIRLHGRMEALDPNPGEPGHPIPGEPEVDVGGATLRKGDTVVLRPALDRDVYDKMLHGRTATIERIYYDYDDAIHVGVTVDDDPAQELFRESGRYLFFKGDEVEAAT